MNIEEVLTMPHTADESLPVLRAWSPRDAAAMEKRFSVELGDAPQKIVDAVQAQMKRFMRQEIQDELQTISDLTAHLSHKSCRKFAVVGPRYRKHRDQMAFAKLRIDRNTDAEGKAEKLERERFIAAKADKSPSTRNAELSTDLEQIELVTPLGERGPPSLRDSSKNRGPGRPIHLLKSIVPTGMSGGDG